MRGKSVESPRKLWESPVNMEKPPQKQWESPLTLEKSPSTHDYIA